MIRPVMKVGSYDNEEHYLDVQFRLLKEDLLAPLRDGIHEIKFKVAHREQKIALKGYRGLKLLYTVCTNQG